MNTIEKFFIIVMLLLIISATPSLSIDSNLKEISSNCSFTELKTKIYDNDTVHHLCFVESGYVDHDHVSIHGFYTQFLPLYFCIGCVNLDLVAFPFKPEEPRLKIISFSGEIIYEKNISVSIKGFIGKVCHTGGVAVGILKGFALIVKITPL